jgi:lipopolysaccharide transport system permease protein
LRDLRDYRAVLYALCARDLRGKYRQAVLGITWAIFQPLVQVGIFTFLMRGVARVETEVPYPLFVVASLLPFNLFQQTVGMGTPAFVSARGIVTKVYFPRVYTVIAASTSAAVNFAVSFAVLVMAMLWYGRGPTTGAALLWIPLSIGAVLFLSVGTAALLAAINARFRDVQHALPVLLAALLFLTPILYPPEAAPETARVLFAWNPLGGLVETFRCAVLGLEPPAAPLAIAHLLACTVIGGAGIWWFERSQSELVDVL